MNGKVSVQDRAWIGGAGEEVMGATAAAVVNAFFDATGSRLRQYPMTPERVRTALATRS